MHLGAVDAKRDHHHCILRSLKFEGVGGYIGNLFGY